MDNYHEGFHVTSSNQYNSVEIGAYVPCGYITINGIGTVELRSSFGGDGLRTNLEFQEAFMNLVNQEGGGSDMATLSSKPILLKHEHQLPYEPQSYLFIRKEREDGKNILRFRYFMWMTDRVIRDVTVILEEKNILVSGNPRNIYMLKDDFGRLIRVLAIAHKIQVEKYQQEVDNLLSILPPL